MLCSCQKKSTTKQFFYLLFFSLIFFFSTPSISHAAKLGQATKCDLPVENKDNSLYFTAINDQTQDCATGYKEDSIVSTNNINGLEATCSDDPTFTAQFVGEGLGEEGYIYSKDGTGTTTVDLLFAKNFTNDIQTVKKNADNIAPFWGGATLTGAFNSSYYYDDCNNRQIFDHLACSIARGTAITLPSGKQLYNSLADSNYLQRVSLPGYIDKEFNLKNAERQTLCVEEPKYINEIPCYNKYTVAPGQDSYANALMVEAEIRPDTPVSAILHKEIAKQWSIRSQKSLYQYGYWVALIPKKNLENQNGYFTVRDVFNAEKKPEIIQKGEIPINFLAEMNDVFIRYNLPQKGKEESEAIKALNKSDDGGANYREKIIKKIYKKFPDNTCTVLHKDVDFNGAKASSRSMVDNGLLNWVIDFLHINRAEPDTEGQEHKVYTAYVLVPSEVQQTGHYTGLNDYGFDRAFFLPQAKQWFTDNKQIDAQQTIYSVPPQANSKSGTFIDQINKFFCGDEKVEAWCPREVEKNFNYLGGGAWVALKNAGFAVTTTFRNIIGGVTQLPNNPMHFKQGENCYYAGLQKRVAAAGINLNDSEHLNLDSGDTPNEEDCVGSITYSDNSSKKIAEGDICAVADKYNIPCCQLKGIMEQESGTGSGGTGSCQSGNNTYNCCTGIGCGPAQLTCGQIDDFQGGEDIDPCSQVGAAELLARAMKVKLCQADGKCNAYDWSRMKDIAMSYEIGDGDYTAAAYFNGSSNGCTVTGCSQYRWGAGKTYCDSIESYCATGSILPSVGDQNFCSACNTELIRSGVKPMSCSGGSSL